jgi:hypothetical protein
MSREPRGYQRRPWLCLSVGCAISRSSQDDCPQSRAVIQHHPRTGGTSRKKR